MLMKLTDTRTRCPVSV